MNKYIFLNPVTNPIIPDEKNNDTKLIIQISENKIKINITIKYNNYTTNTYNKSYDLTKIEENTIYSVRCTIDGFYPFLISDDYGIVRDEEVEMLRFYVSKDRKNLEMECFRNTKFENTDNLNIDYAINLNSNTNFHFSYYIKEKYPEYKKCYSVEKDSLGEILNPNKTLSYMDAQVDIITKFLIDIIEKNKKVLSPESQKVYENFKEIFNNTSLLNTMTIEKLKNKMRHKVTTRDFQEKRRVLFDKKERNKY